MFTRETRRVICNGLICYRILRQRTQRTTTATWTWSVSEIWLPRKFISKLSSIFPQVVSQPLLSFVCSSDQSPFLRFVSTRLPAFLLVVTSVYRLFIRQTIFLEFGLARFLCKVAKSVELNVFSADQIIALKLAQPSFTATLLVVSSFSILIAWSAFSLKPIASSHFIVTSRLYHYVFVHHSNSSSQKVISQPIFLEVICL